MDNYKIFCDMDGVLIDFDKGYHTLTGRDIRGQHFTDSFFWDPINNAGYEFWYNLEWMNDGKDLWNYISPHKPELLSAPSRQPESRVAKHDWVSREIPGTTLHLRKAKHKKDFSSRNHILIDDRLFNIEGWIVAGGIGVLHKSAKDTIKQLRKLGL